MRQRFIDNMFGNYTQGHGTKGLRWLSVVALLFLALQLRSIVM